MKTLSIIIPVYNEQKTILSLLRVVEDVPLEDFNKEIIIVDDGSTDGTIEILRSLSANYKIIFQPKNFGKGAAVIKGLSVATGDIALIQDADLEYSPYDYPSLIKSIVDNDADVVYGSRFITSKPHRVLYFWHSIGNHFLTLFSNMMTNLSLTDMETCYKVFNREAINYLNGRLSSQRFGIEPEITAHLARGNFRIYEVGISYCGRTYQEGKKIGWRDGFSAIWSIIKFNLFYSEKTTELSVTRGSGVLEKNLAKRRAKLVNSLIPNSLRTGRILDIGCGTIPYFLNSIKFGDKFGIDKNMSEQVGSDIVLKKYNFELAVSLPFSDSFFSAVSLLAVIEHINEVTSLHILKESHRTLQSGGALIITTPWGGAKGLLELLARLNIVSPEEINEHQQFFSKKMLLEQLVRAGFSADNIEVGSFQFGLNLFAIAKK